MNENKRANWKPLQGTLLVFLAIGILGLTFFFAKYNDVFPAASLDLKLSKDEIVTRARKFASDVGYVTKGCVDSTTFSERSEVATFLEHEYSMREANELMHSKINVFFWYTRFCRPKEEEEFQVAQDPEGKLVALNHVIENETKLPSVSIDEAQIMALKFVEKVGDKLYSELPDRPIPLKSSAKETETSAATPSSDVVTPPAKAAAPSADVVTPPAKAATPSADVATPSAKAATPPANAKTTTNPDQDNIASKAGAVEEAGGTDGASKPSPDAKEDVTSKIKLADGIKLISKGSMKQLNRTDHYFTWEDQKQNFKGGHLRTTVGVSGNEITSFERELHVPQEFSHKFANMRSYNNLLKSISSILFAVVGAGMFFAFVWALSTKRLRWRLVIAAAVASFAIELLDYWNNWPSIVQQYATTETLQNYLGSKIVNSLIAAATTALSACVLVGGIEAIYRSKFPKYVAGEHILNFKMLSNRALLETIIAGICVFGIHIGYVAAYYLIGTKLGMWSPLEVRDVATMSSISPAFSSFAVGVNASVSEELLYRVLCFTIAQHFVKNFWVANFIQAAGWAFMHSDYPQEPAYARGLELTIVGLFYGYVMRKYGVMAGIISHFIYDAFLGITPLLFSPNPVLAFSGILACAPPFVLLGIGIARRNRLGEDVPEEVVVNENLVPHSEEEIKVVPEERHLSYSPLGAKVKAILLLLCLGSAMVFAFVEPRKMGNWARMSITKAQVVEVARNFLKERGVTEGDWTVSAMLNVNIDSEEVQYGFEKEGYKKTEKIMKAARVPLLWLVRFFKPHQQREYSVFVTAEGRAVAMQISDDDDAKGKTITQDEAKKLTEAFLKQYRPEFTPLQFESVTEQKRENRNDNAVSYVVPAFKMGEARLKISVDTVGDVVSFPHVTWDIPDKWRFERSIETTKDHVASALAKIASVLGIVLVLIWAYGVVRASAIHWRAAIITGAFVAMVTLVGEANELQYNLIEYDTDVPFLSFLADQAVKAIVAAITNGAGFAVAVAISHAAFRLLCPGVTLASLWHSTIQPTVDRLKEAKVLWVDGTISAYTWIFATNALAVSSSYFEGLFSPEVRVQSLSGLVNSTHYLSPALEEAMTALTIGLASLCLAPTAVGFYLKYFRNFKRYLLFSIIFLLIITSTRKYWQDYAIDISMGGIEIIGVFLWVKYCARNNPVAYFLVGALNSLTVSIFQLYKLTSNVYSSDLIAMFGMFLLPIIIAIAIRKGKSTISTEAASSP